MFLLRMASRLGNINKVVNGMIQEALSTVMTDSRDKHEIIKKWKAETFC